MWSCIIFSSISSTYPASARDKTPDFLTIGHVTRDQHSIGSFSLGGTVTFASCCAQQLGLNAALVTCADEALTFRLRQEVSQVALHVRTTRESTTFANVYDQGFRTQYLYARADTLRYDDIPTAWLDAPVILFAPLAQELTPEIVTRVPRRAGMLRAATPQGWLRRWDTDGRVWPTAWTDAEQVLPLLDVLILSHDDLLPFADGDRTAADAILMRWSQMVPLLVATDGRHGATLFRQGNTRRFPAYQVTEVDPTGAGDVFAAAFLVYLQRYQDPEEAVNFANCVASFSVEQPGITGIPTLFQTRQRLRSLSS